jgi:hypothetical protein
MAGFRTRFGACLGFDPEARAPTSTPTIMLVDRPYEAQRHLENVQELQRELRDAYGGFADVRLQYMEVRKQNLCVRLRLADGGGGWHAACKCWHAGHINLPEARCWAVPFASGFMPSSEASGGP